MVDVNEKQMLVSKPADDAEEEVEAGGESTPTSADKKRRGPGSRGDTALHISCTNGHLETVKLLVGYGNAEMNNPASADGFTALMRCCEHKHYDCAAYLLEMGANVNAQDRWGHTSLHWALIHHPPLVPKLMEHGGKPCPWRCAKCEANLKKFDEQRAREARRAASKGEPASPQKGNGEAGGAAGAAAADEGSTLAPVAAPSSPSPPPAAKTPPPPPPPPPSTGSGEKPKSGGGGGSSSGGKAPSVAHLDLIQKLGLPQHRPLHKDELDRLDVARCKQIFTHDPNDPNWISFTPADAKWVPFSVDPRMKAVFEEVGQLREERGPEQEKLMIDWMCRAETVVHEWVCRAVVQSEKRAACFRSLGRGWIFMQLSSHGERNNRGVAMDHLNHRTRFKWWFEGVERIVRNRTPEFHTTLNLPDGEVEKWLYGYQINSEIVFVLRGMAPGRATMSRRKWRADYHKQHIWASNDQIEKELNEGIMIEEERQALAAKVDKEREKRKAKRERQKAKKKEASGVSGEALLRQEEERQEAEAREATDAFDSLLQELKMEEKQLQDEAAGGGGAVAVPEVK